MNSDILKLAVVLTALIYLNVRVRKSAAPLNYWIMNTGLCLLLLAAILDFADGIRSLDYFPVLGEKALFHDVLEDQFFDTPGLLLFALGAFKQILKKS